MVFCIRKLGLRTASRAYNTPVCCRMSKSQAPLVVVGSVNADLVVSISRLPHPGETISSPNLETFPGGKGANQAAAAAKLEYPTYFVGQVGTDANASTLRDSLEGCGVNISHLRTVDGPSGTALILLQSGGENSIIIVGGANHTGWSLTDNAQQVIKSAGAVLLQREIPEDVNISVAQAAHAAGVKVVLDAGGVEGPISGELLSAVSVLSPNETELARLTGLPTNNEEQIVEAAEKLMLQGAQSVLVKLGADGSMLIPGPGQPPIRQSALPAEKVVDTTGAGDCFTAAYAVAMLEGKSPKDSLMFASAAACLCVQRLGAQPSMPTRQELGPLFAKSQ